MAFNGFGISLGRLAVTPATLTAKPRGSVVFLHGTCDSGNGLKRWLKCITRSEFAFPEFRVLYPTAPRQPYSLLNGQSAEVWFDRLSLGPEMPEDVKSMQATCEALSGMLTRESESSGIPLSKTVVGGFSTGGTIAMHLGYRFHHQLAGIFALSSFLHPDSIVYEHLHEHANTCKSMEKPKRPPPGSASSFDTDRKESSSVANTPTINEIYNDIEMQEDNRNQPHVPRLFMSQGTLDPLVQYPWARSTFQALQSYGAEGHFHTLEHMKHEIDKRELSLLYDWIKYVLADKPPNSSGPKKPRKERKYKVKRGITISTRD